MSLPIRATSADRRNGCCSEFSKNAGISRPMTLDNLTRSVPFVRGSTKVIGVFGHPVTHSLSPAMHNAAIAALGLPFVYVPFPVAPEELGAALGALRALGIVGVNLTIPHKEAALACVDEITPEARDV